MNPRGSDDRTVRMRPPAAKSGQLAAASSGPDANQDGAGARGRRAKWVLPGLGGAGALLVVLVAGYLALRPASVPVPPPALPQTASIPVAPVPAVPAPAAPAPAPAPALALTARTADEAAIAAHVATTLTLFRFAPNPNILVLDFPGLHQQGLMLNRVAAMVEKAGLPHDRVLTDAELDAAIRAHGDTVDTYYYGHDYPAADLAAFFARADRQGVRLGAEEEALRAMLTQQGLLEPGSRGALISIPSVNAAQGIDEAMRASILRHELSHGEFFSNPAYAAYARKFYNEIMPEPARKAFLAYLVSQEYDPAVPDLVINETQAYLMNTADPRLFNAAVVGMTDAGLNILRVRFLAGMPAGWLRDRIALPPAVAASANAASRPAPEGAPVRQ